MNDQTPEDESDLPLGELLARFREAHPEAGTEEFEAWLAARARALEHGRLRHLAEDVLARLDESSAGQGSLFRPPDAGAPPQAHEPTRFASGDRIGAFELRRYVAAGGMGQVWEAVEHPLGRTVALKLLLPGAFDEALLARFAREARAGGRLRHPNLVTTYAYGWDQGLSWISQEFVPGAKTLADLIDEQRARPAPGAAHYEQVAQRVGALADGLHAAHEAGVIHRDVKPANILVAPDHSLRLADFGLARVGAETALSRSGELAGTWAYMSPEQLRARRRQIDRRTDVFSLGVVLYELLTHQRPFDGDTVEQTAEQILSHDPPAPSELRSGCPRDLSWICLKALEKQPSARYANAAELASDLRRHLANQTLSARPPSRRDRCSRWIRRNPTASSIGAVGLLGLLLISALLAVRLADARALARSSTLLQLEAQAAESERVALLRLTAQAELDALLLAQAELWPPWPDRADALEDWCERARRLVERLPQHRLDLAELERRLARASEDEELVWWRDRLATLIASLEGLSQDHLEPSASEDGWGVARRKAFAEQLARERAPGAAIDRAWSEALPELRREFPTLPFEDWVGLQPLGRDVESGLWEFAHLASGEVPARADSGQLVLGAETGIVLVLIPGGESWVGMQRDDPDMPNHDPDAPGFGSRPARLIRLSPYLIAKFETTRTQWRTLAGVDPSSRALGVDGASARDPVTGVSWDAAQLTLERFGLTLATEAQWEHACRAGSTTVYAGGGPLDMDGRMNVSDRSALAAEVGFPTDKHTAQLEDGAVYELAVGSYAPNAFGLHDMHGNAWEWVRDGARFGAYAAEEETLDPWIAPTADSQRILRGGSFRLPPVAARSYFRMAASPGDRGSSLGVRAVLEPERR